MLPLVLAIALAAAAAPALAGPRVPLKPAAHLAVAPAAAPAERPAQPLDTAAAPAVAALLDASPSVPAAAENWPSPSQDKWPSPIKSDTHRQWLLSSVLGVVAMAGALGGAARVIRQRLAAPAQTVVDVELAENGVADASRRAVMAGLGGALLAAPAPAFAQKSKMIPRATRDSQEKARAYKFSKPSEPSEEFKANERRRADISAGLTPRDANTTPIRDPVSGDIIANRRTYAEAVKGGADICKNPSSGFRPRGCS